MSMDVMSVMGEHGHEQVVFCRDHASGLRAVIGIHNTVLGPAIGGTRMRRYDSEDDAVLDALRISRSMTYKAAAAGLNLGGGKCVIMGDPRKEKSEALFRALGRFIESLEGRYITAEDVGTTVDDMEYVYMETRHVTGITVAHGGSGDPSPVSAYGVFRGIEAAVKTKFGREDLTGLTVAVQGVGSVGYFLIKQLHEAGARIMACDIEPDRARRVAEEFGVDVVDPATIYDVSAEVFSPCALGAILNDETIPRLKAKVVCGGANNQLAVPGRHGALLDEKSILYAPDYVVNAGGLINVFCELEGYVRERAMRRTSGIYETTLRVFEIARDRGMPTSQAADLMAEERIAKIGDVRRNWIGKSPFRTRN
jgi:leucine dehydrogenase